MVEALAGRSLGEHTRDPRSLDGMREDALTFPVLEGIEFRACSVGTASSRAHRRSSPRSPSLPASGPRARAHTKREATIPEGVAVLELAPDVVSMSFDAPMRITSIRLSGEAGGTYALERSDAMEPATEFRATPPPLLRGRYTVEWRGLSSDGHPMKCRFSFEVAP